MPQVLLPNLLFENELDRRVVCVSSTAKRAVAERSHLMGLLSPAGSGPGDTVVVPENGMPRDLPPVLKSVRFVTAESFRCDDSNHADFCPWGWSHEAVQLGHQMQLRFDAPDSNIVRLINSREFLAPFDNCVDVASFTGRAAVPHADSAKTLSCDLMPVHDLNRRPFGVLCWSIHDVHTALSRFAGHGNSRWVIKASLSQAARSRLTGRTLPHTTAELSWLQTRFDAGQAVYAEPWVDRQAECGLQFSVPPLSSSPASVQFEGATELLTDEAGHYLGSVIAAAEVPGNSAWWLPAIEHGRIIAEHSRTLGFFGPMGIDCMALRSPDSQQVLLRCCHDINGRMTMGRVALSLRRHLQSGEFGIWCHCNAKSQRSLENLLTTAQQTGIRILPTSAGRVGVLPLTLRTVLLMSHDPQRLIQAIRNLFGPQIRPPFAEL